MSNNNILLYISDLIKNVPADWIKLTTHRLDIYNESLAKTEFLEEFEALVKSNNSQTEALAALPTAYDYIRLGHPLSTVLEWSLAQLNELNPQNVISFSSNTTPILSLLRKNLLSNKNTRILYTDLPEHFDADSIRKVYGYNFELQQVSNLENIAAFDGSTVFVSSHSKVEKTTLLDSIDFYVDLYPHLGSILLVNGAKNESYISEIQHVRRRETIAMTPANCLVALKMLVGETISHEGDSNADSNKKQVLQSIKEITGSDTKALVCSSGLSTQYAIMMGLIDHALENHAGKAIKIIVPPNCYGGTNDQARRIAACIDQVEVLDLPVDGDHNMVESIDMVLNKVAQEDAIPFIIAEIPTNPRVEVPDLIELKNVLGKQRNTAANETAIAPVFILDQTFCPNVQFLGDNDILAAIQTIVYVSGSKFPSGGKCTAGYCLANRKAAALMDKIEKHLILCDNEATDLQLEFLAEQLPSMLQRIADAYTNTREFVNYIKEVLPDAKINFVSEELAEEGFTPSVFSLDLPTKGNTDEERELYKRELNNKLINLMITKIPNESKYCVSYGQLKGCYWTIPATSTQGTTKEGDKDYIARVALSSNMDMDLHKMVFKEFVEGM